jgi:hypothetical protein
VVEVGVGVEHDVGQRAHVAQVVEQLAGLHERGPRVDDEDPVAADDRADRLVEEGESADEDAVGDLAPGVHVVGRVPGAAFGARDSLSIGGMPASKRAGLLSPLGWS